MWYNIIMVNKEFGGIMYYSVNQLAEILQVTRGTIYKWIKKGKIKYIKIDRVIRIPSRELEEKTKKEWIEKGKEK